MLRKLLTSIEFAVLVLAAAAMSLVLLYLTGRKLETYIGSALLLFAAVLIFFGDRKKNSERR